MSALNASASQILSDRLKRNPRPVTLAVAFYLSVIGALSVHKASLKRLTEIPLTVLGFASIDFAAFHLAHGWGWLVTGLSLILLEHLISDEAP